VRRTEADRLLMMAQAHKLRRQGRTQKYIIETMGVAKTTLQAWFRLPPPTDDEIKAAQTLTAAKLSRPPESKKTTKGIKTYLSDRTIARMKADAEMQGTTVSQLLSLAMEMYLDTFDQWRAKREEIQINIAKYRFKV